MLKKGLYIILLANFIISDEAPDPILPFPEKIIGAFDSLINLEASRI